MRMICNAVLQNKYKKSPFPMHELFGFGTTVPDMVSLFGLTGL